jgi:hypothetical protein
MGERALKALVWVVCPVPPFAIVKADPRVSEEALIVFEPTIDP